MIVAVGTSMYRMEVWAAGLREQLWNNGVLEQYLVSERTSGISAG